LPTKKWNERGRKAYESGLELENRAAKWLNWQFGYECKKRELALTREKSSKKLYEVDVYGVYKQFLGMFKTHLWVECKPYEIKRTNVAVFVESARDVKTMHKECGDVQKWCADILMLVSDVGFEVDAVSLANRYNLYCVEAGKSFNFVGKQDRRDFEAKKRSKY